MGVTKSTKHLTKDMVPQKIFQSETRKKTQYMKDQVTRIYNAQKCIDGTINGHIEALKRLKKISPLPKDAVYKRKVKLNNGEEQEKEFRHEGNSYFNEILDASIKQIEGILKARLGRKNEGMIF